MAEATLYERLGGVFAIAAVIAHSAMRSSRTPRSGKHRRTPSSVSGTPNSWTGCRDSSSCGRCGSATSPVDRSRSAPRSREDTALGLEEAHRALHITPDEFDEVAADFGRALDHFGVPAREKDEVLGAFAAHKGEVTEGSMASA